MTVYLVGAGPGDPGLVTVRGAELLGRADVVVYDRLAHPSLLDLAPEAAERIDVGKAPGRAAQLATWAAAEALADAGSPERGARCGLTCGTTLGGIGGWLPLVRADEAAGPSDAAAAAIAAPRGWGYP
ncbi:MAG: SAM-dependent methyltransferase, partial [Acidimicrobiia bacterium]